MSEFLPARRNVRYVSYINDAARRGSLRIALYDVRRTQAGTIPIPRAGLRPPVASRRVSEL